VNIVAIDYKTINVPPSGELESTLGVSADLKANSRGREGGTHDVQQSRVVRQQ
jgi:hypothetical protein